MQHIKRPRSSRRRLLVGAVAVATLLGACSDEARDEIEDDVRDAVTTVQDAVDQASARAVAEAFRVSIRARGGEGSLRRVERIREAIDVLPGDPRAAGLTDGNGDGLDDDGRVQFSVGDDHACVQLPESGTNIDISNGRCE